MQKQVMTDKNVTLTMTSLHTDCAKTAKMRFWHSFRMVIGR